MSNKAKWKVAEILAEIGTRAYLFKKIFTKKNNWKCVCSLIALASYKHIKSHIFKKNAKCSFSNPMQSWTKNFKVSLEHGNLV